MLSDEVIEKVTERIVNRIEQVNSFILEKIGKDIKKIGTLSPTDAQRLAQIIRYGGDYDKIVQKLAKITELNVKDLYKIFNEVAKSDYQFKKGFYEYRNKMFIPYEDNIALQNQVNALANITAREYINLTRTTAIGFSVRDRFGNLVFKDLSQAYIDILDKAVLAISQGKSTFQEEMYRTIKELGESGIKTIDYASGRSVRLDSAIRTSLRGGLRDMRYETQKFYGEEFGYDGFEISVHENPAIDHQDAQGRMFTIEEFNKLQSTGVARDVKGRLINIHLDLKTTTATSLSFRPIREYNCYHGEFPIIIDVNKPQYTDKELQEIKDRNEKGFYLFNKKTGDDKHYTMYEGTQMQRRIETSIRQAKDQQIIARASGNMDLVSEAQDKIRKITSRYKELCDKSGLPSQLQRARVSGYKRIAIKK